MKMKLLQCAWAGLLLASCSSYSGLTRVETGVTSPRERALENQILEEVNGYRESVGIAPLTRHPGLDRMARQHCVFLRDNRGKFGLYGKNVSHFGFEGRAAVARQSMNLDNIAENVIAGHGLSGDLAAALVRGWRNSPGHEENMRLKWGVTGVGVAFDEEGRVYATQLFASPGVRQSIWAGPARQF